MSLIAFSMSFGLCLAGHLHGQPHVICRQLEKPLAGKMDAVGCAERLPAEIKQFLKDAKEVLGVSREDITNVQCVPTSTQDGDGDESYSFHS